MSLRTSSDEMLRAFSRALDGPAQPDEARRYRYRVVQGERVCGWSCDASSPYFAQDAHLCPAECLARRGASLQSAPRLRRPAARGGASPPPPELIADVCPSPPPPPPPRGGGVATCADDSAALRRAGVWLLVGVQTAPSHAARREGVRASWKRFEAEVGGALVCFLIGRRGLDAATRATLDEEGRAHRDILFLEEATDAGVPTIKGYHWWRAAAKLLPPEGSTSGIRIAAKVDDDSFLHIGNLAADMQRLHCARYLHYGSMGFTGYDPSIWRLCGWSWQPRGGNYRKEHCARKGAYPPFPFMNGALELLSAPLVRYVAESPEVAAFVKRAEAAVEARKAAGWGMSLKKGQLGPRVWRQNEDVALGFWLSRAERRGLFNITWVRINDRAINMACISTKGMYQRPRNDTISVHFLKKPAGGVYLWGLYHGVPHSAENCTRWVWHDNCREPVKKSSAAWCAKYKHKVDTSFESAPLRAEDKKAARRASHIKRIP